jgi:hypothetical protein
MDTDLQMRGKVAQFGRGAMEKISQRMFEQFAQNIEQAVAGDGGAPAAEAGTDGEAEGDRDAAPAGRAPAPAPAAPARPAAAAPDDDDGSLDVLSTFGGPALQKAAPLVGTAVLALVYGVLLGRLREARALNRRLERLL